MKYGCFLFLRINICHNNVNISSNIITNIVIGIINYQLAALTSAGLPNALWVETAERNSINKLIQIEVKE